MSRYGLSLTVLDRLSLHAGDGHASQHRAKRMGFRKSALARRRQRVSRAPCQPRSSPRRPNLVVQKICRSMSRFRRHCLSSAWMTGVTASVGAVEEIMPPAIGGAILLIASEPALRMMGSRGNDRRQVHHFWPHPFRRAFHCRRIRAIGINAPSRRRRLSAIAVDRQTRPRTPQSVHCGSKHQKRISISCAISHRFMAVTAPANPSICNRRQPRSAVPPSRCSQLDAV